MSTPSCCDFLFTLSRCLVARASISPFCKAKETTRCILCAGQRLTCTFSQPSSGRSHDKRECTRHGVSRSPDKTTETAARKPKIQLPLHGSPGDCYELLECEEPSVRLSPTARIHCRGNRRVPSNGQRLSLQRSRGAYNRGSPRRLHSICSHCSEVPLAAHCGSKQQTHLLDPLHRERVWNRRRTRSHCSYLRSESLVNTPLWLRLRQLNRVPSIVCQSKEVKCAFAADSRVEPILGQIAAIAGN